MFEFDFQYNREQQERIRHFCVSDRFLVQREIVGMKLERTVKKLMYQYWRRYRAVMFLSRSMKVRKN